MIKSNGARVNVFPEKMHHRLNNKPTRVRLTAYSTLELLWSKQVNWKSTVTTLCPLRANPHFWKYCEANKRTGLRCVHWEPTRTFGTIVKQTSELEEYSDYMCPLRTKPHFWNYCEANKRTERVQRLILWRGTPHPDWLQSIKRPSGCYLRGCYLRTSANGKGRAWEDGNTGTKKAKTHTELVNFVVLVEKADRRPCFFLEQDCNKMSSTSEQLPLESHASSLDVSGYSEN